MSFGEDRFKRIKEDLKSLSEDGAKTNLLKMIDPGCQLRTIQKYIESLDENWSNKLKDHLTKTRAIVINGQIFAANLVISNRNLLDQNKLKSVLGDDLSDYKSEIPITSLTFKPRF